MPFVKGDVHATIFSFPLSLHNSGGINSIRGKELSSDAYHRDMVGFRSNPPVKVQTLPVVLFFMCMLNKIKNNFGSPFTTIIRVKDIKFNFIEKRTCNYVKQSWYNWDELKDSLNTHGYNPEKHNYITISSDNICVDGNHRLFLLKQSQEEKVIKVKKIEYPFWFYFFCSIIFNIFTLNLKVQLKRKWIK